MRYDMTTPAPISRAALEKVFLPAGQGGRLLPQEAYTSAELLEWERLHLFEGSWVCAGMAGNLAKPGDQTAVRVGRDTILLVRGEDERIRGFYNVCRHRAHELLQAGECRNGKALRCPYHGWTYKLDGSLRAEVKGHHVPEFDPAAEGLVPARVEVWHGWIFVNASGDAPPFAEWVGELEAIVAPYEPERLKLGASHEYEIATNWKLICENYHECYHCPQIHPQLCRVSPPDSGDNYDRNGAFVGGSMDLVPHAVTMSFDGHSDGVPLRGLSAEALRVVHYYHLFSNVLISLHPDYVMTHRMEPLSTNRTKVECQWLFAPEAFEKPGFSSKYAEEFWDETNWQDWRAVESVQRGIESRGYVPGTLTPREDAVHHFVTRIARGYLTGALRPETSMAVARS
jgi:phenylpropionate dioxygenase-like ring-hydroxylating dioxygenase large terminal subunit